MEPRTSRVEIAPDERSSKSQWRHSLAGLGAGFVSALVTCPLDVVKTRLQYQTTFNTTIDSAVTLSNYPTSYRPYYGTFPTLRRIYREEGLRGNFRGLAPSLLGYIPSWAIYFTFYEYFKAKLDSGTQLPSPVIHMTSAMSAGIVNTTLTNPIWVIKTRLMTQSVYTPYHYKNTWHAFSSLWKEEGIKGYYRGLGPSLLGVAHVAVQFPLYEQFKTQLINRKIHQRSNLADDKKNETNVQLEPVDFLMASIGSKILATTATYPHEVIRTRMQTEMKGKFIGIIATAKKIYGEQGIVTFYRGWSTNLLRVTPANAITLVTYELLLRTFSQF